MKNAFWGCLTLKIMFWKINFRRNLVLGKRTIFTVMETQVQNPKSVFDGEQICNPGRSQQPGTTGQQASRRLDLDGGGVHAFLPAVSRQGLPLLLSKW